MVFILAVELPRLETLQVHPIQNPQVYGVLLLGSVVPVLGWLRQSVVLLLRHWIVHVGKGNTAGLAKDLRCDAVAKYVSANFVIVSCQHNLGSIRVHPNVSVL